MSLPWKLSPEPRITSKPLSNVEEAATPSNTQTRARRAWWRPMSSRESPTLLSSRATEGGGGARRSGASAKMAAAAAGRSARLAAWGGRLRRGLAAGRRTVPSRGPLAAAVAGVALAGAGAAWHHGRVKAAAREGTYTVLAQVRLSPAPPSGAPGREAEACGRPQAAGASPEDCGGRWREAPPGMRACGRGSGHASAHLVEKRSGLEIRGCWAPPASPGGTLVNLRC